jgi:hypothetical protein
MIPFGMASPDFLVTATTITTTTTITKDNLFVTLSSVNVNIL